MRLLPKSIAQHRASIVFRDDYRNAGQEAHGFRLRGWKVSRRKADKFEKLQKKSTELAGGLSVRQWTEKRARKTCRDQFLIRALL